MLEESTLSSTPTSHSVSPSVPKSSISFAWRVSFARSTLTLTCTSFRCWVFSCSSLAAQRIVINLSKHVSPISCGSCAAALLFVQFLWIGWVEGKRWADLKNPGSQGDGSFFGITDDFKPQSNGCPSQTVFPTCTHGLSNSVDYLPRGLNMPSAYNAIEKDTTSKLVLPERCYQYILWFIRVQQLAQELQLVEFYFCMEIWQANLNASL